MVNSVALAAAIAKSLDGFTPYFGLAIDGSYTPQRISITPDSSLNAYGVVLDKSDALINDEYHHNLDAICSGRMKTKSKAIYNATIKRCDNAPLSVLLDANLTDLDVSVFGIKPIKILVTQQRQQQFTTRVTRSMESIELQLLAAFANNETAWFCSNSEKIAYAMYKKACKAHPAGRFLFQGAKKGRSTTGNGENKAFTDNINRECVKYDGVFSSPAISTGLSITVEHFDHHCAVFTNGTGDDLMTQMLGRDRTAKHWEVCLLGNGRNGAPRTDKERNDDLIAQYKLNCELTGMEPSQSLSTFAAHKNARAGVKAMLLRNWQQSICFALERDAASVEYDNAPDTLEYKRANEDFYQALDVEFAKDLANSIDVSDLGKSDLGGLDGLDDKQNYSQQDSTISAGFEAQAITHFFGIDKEQITAGIVQIYNNGNIGAQVENFRMIDATDKPSADEPNVDMALASFKAAKQAGIQEVNRLAPGLLQGKTAINADDALALFAQLKKSPVAAGVGMVWNMRNQPTIAGAIKWLGVGLKKQGLWVDSEGDKNDRHYRVQESQKVTRAGRIAIPGLKIMEALATEKAGSSLITILDSQLPDRHLPESIESGHLPANDQLPAFPVADPELPDRHLPESIESGHLPAEDFWQRMDFEIAA
jgi:hypothetical protein